MKQLIFIILYIALIYCSCYYVRGVVKKRNDLDKVIGIIDYDYNNIQDVKTNSIYDFYILLVDIDREREKVIDFIKKRIQNINETVSTLRIQTIDVTRLSSAQLRDILSCEDDDNKLNEVLMKYT